VGIVRHKVAKTKNTFTTLNTGRLASAVGIASLAVGTASSAETQTARAEAIRKAR